KAAQPCRSRAVVVSKVSGIGCPNSIRRNQTTHAAKASEPRTARKRETSDIEAGSGDAGEDREEAHEHRDREQEEDEVQEGAAEMRDCEIAKQETLELGGGVGIADDPSLAFRMEDEEPGASQASQ